MPIYRFDTPHAVSLDAKIGSGSVEIEAADRSETTVRIEGLRDPDDVKVEERALPDGGLGISIEQRRSIRGRSRELRVLVSTRSGVDVQSETGSADLIVHGTAGTIAFRTGSGDLLFEHADGDVSMKTGSGDLRGGGISGDLAAHTASGDLRLERVDGDTVVRTASGDLSLGASGGDVRVSTASGDVVVRHLGSGQVTVHCVSGGVHLGVPAGLGVWMDLSSTSGTASSELEPGESSNGEPDLDLRVTTVSGDIRIVRATNGV
jgi:DUF4097 and DUF4098 domain-containing protein YvlB